MGRQGWVNGLGSTCAVFYTGHVERPKKKQHYVFRAYLKPWSHDDKIFCLRQGRIFRPNLMGVACERFFYRLEALTQREAELVERGMIENTAEPLKTLLRNFVALHSLAPMLRKYATERANPKFVTALENMINNGGENYHQLVEGSLLIFLQRMLAGETAFYSDAEEAAKFLYAICVQFTRTKQVREAAVAQLGVEFQGCNVRRVTGVLSHLVAIMLACSLYGVRTRYKLLLAENPTDTPFLTGDQPVINLQVTHKGDPVDKVEFFYPISPTRAAMLLELSNPIASGPLTSVVVNHLNMLMVQNSFEQLFSNSEEYLDVINRAGAEAARSLFASTGPST